ncbi:kelch-like protein 24 [Gigantopelta aegis]|uniref:kelch-like protein 24 n=1 Tax=Gigantopelta aegis TaxID=1735272 RepID=UPI001B888434|nr:kelch-like protein 24 [Gigantopelta aegis]
MTNMASDTFAHQMMENIHRMYKEQRHTDIEVKVKDTTFECHKLVLAAMSPYFDAMFYSGMIECTDNVVRLQNLSASTFESVLSFLYLGKCHIHTENVEDLLKASAMFQIGMLTQMCELFLVNHVDPENCIAMWKLASMHRCKILEHTSFSFILSNIQDIMNTDNFNRLDKDELLLIISHDELNVANEEIVCDAIFTWYKSDDVARKSDFEDLFEHLRLPLVSSEYLVNNVDSLEVVTSSKKCQEIVKEAISYHMLPARRHEIVSPRVIYRKHALHEEVLVVLGGYSQSGQKVIDVLGYSFRQEKWFILCPLIYKLGREYACCVYGNDIYVSGGSQRLQSLVRFSAEYNQWQRCASMAQGRRRHAMVAVGESLFVIGGYDDKTNDELKRTLIDIEEYNISTSCWYTVGTLVKPVRSMSSAVSKEKILIFGGLLRGEHETAAIQSYDTRTQSCTIVGDLPLCCKLTRSVTFDKRILIFCTDGTVIEVTTDLKFRVFAKIANFTRRRFGVIVHDQMVLILGGESGEKVLRDILMFNPESKTVVSHTNLQMAPARANFGCAKIVMKKRNLTMEWLEDS